MFVRFSLKPGRGRHHRWPAAFGVAVALALGAAGFATAADAPPAHLRLTISGNPASPEFVATLVRTAALAAQPQSGARVLAIWPSPQALDAGFLTNFRVPVSLAGTAGSAAVQTVTVDVINAGTPAFDPTRLAFADDPERITADGVLSRTVVGWQPTRLYYYHQNTGVPRRFCVVLAANGSVMTHVAVVGAAAGPNIDVMSVGHAVSKEFLTRQPRNEGLVIAIAGGKPVLERDAIVGPGEGIVGAIDLRVLDGGPVTATVLAIAPAASPATALYAPKAADDGHTRHGLFDVADFGRLIIAYTAGGPDAAYRYGSRANTPPSDDPTDPGHDYGDYGVLERITFDLANPAQTPTSVYLYEKPLGGDVRSSFLVNGRLIELGCVRVPQRYTIAQVELPAHGSAALNVVTMTDGGSNYPLEIGVGQLPPRPRTPPISTPDGCFPKPGTP